jgi:hypothetical protein
LSEVDHRMTGGPQFVSSSGTPSPLYNLSSPHGPVTNIYPYASDGTPLKDVLLYDQDGRPLRSEIQHWWADRCQRAVSYPQAADGVGVEHSYPKSYLLTGANGSLACNADGYTPQAQIPTFPAPPGNVSPTQAGQQATGSGPGVAEEVPAAPEVPADPQPAPAPEAPPVP